MNRSPAPATEERSDLDSLRSLRQQVAVARVQVTGLQAVVSEETGPDSDIELRLQALEAAGAGGGMSHVQILARTLGC